MADEWKYGQQSLRRPGGSSPYRENAPLMRPISGDLLRRWEPPVSARVEREEGGQPQGEPYSCETAPAWSPSQGPRPPQGPYDSPPMVPLWTGYYPPYAPPQGYPAQPAVPYGFYPYGVPVPYGAAAPYGQGMPPQGVPQPPDASRPMPSSAPPAPQPVPAAPQQQGAVPPAPQPPDPQPSLPPWVQSQREAAFPPPLHQAGTAARESAFTSAPASPAFSSDEEEDWDDGFGDMDRPVPQNPLPPPATIPVGPPPASPRKKGGGGLVALVMVVLLLGCAGALYLSGVLDPQLVSAGIPTWLQMKDRILASEAAVTPLPQVTPVPPAEGQSDEAEALERALENPGGSILPASEGLASLKAFSVSVKEAQAPATLVFTLQTNAAVNDIRLLLPSNQPLEVSGVNKVPTGDGLTWQLTVKFEEPFEGDIRAFLRYDASIWAAGGMSCSVAVKGP